jgi:hypothetical protein
MARFETESELEKEEVATLLGDGSMRNSNMNTSNRGRKAITGTTQRTLAAASDDDALTSSRHNKAASTLTTLSSSSSKQRVYALLAATLLVIGFMAKYYTGIFETTNEGLLEGRLDNNGTTGIASSSSKFHSSKVKKPNRKKQATQTLAPAFTPPLYPLPSLNDELPKGYKKADAKVSDTYLLRGKVVSEALRQKITQQWGSWNFTLPNRAANAQRRPSWAEWREWIQMYPNGDIPLYALMVPPSPSSLTTISDGNTTNSTDGTATHQQPTAEKPKPPNFGSALPWQMDTEYLSQWLPHAMALVERALEGILGEYGHSKFDQPNESFDSRSYMFSTASSRNGYNLKRPPGNAGYATPESLAGIRRRLLHALVTESSFAVVMGGHSAAAGHGNHFQQSYTLQIQRVLEPILARLGVYHQSHNFGMGGMGTAQNGIASADLYGPDMDVIIWDTGMTEGEDSVRDLFARTAFLTGNRVPVLWGDPEYGRYEGAVPGAGQIHTTFWGKKENVLLCGAHVLRVDGSQTPRLLLLLLLF